MAQLPPLPQEWLDYYRQEGRKGGKIGGKRSLDTMTAEERSARAKKAVAAREAKRRNKPAKVAPKSSPRSQ